LWHRLLLRSVRRSTFIGAEQFILSLSKDHSLQLLSIAEQIKENSLLLSRITQNLNKKEIAIKQSLLINSLSGLSLFRNKQSFEECDASEA